VLKVPYSGWKEMALTEYTLVMLFWGGSRWHLNEKFELRHHINTRLGLRWV
jgi:hypothetical protein